MNMIIKKIWDGIVTFFTSWRKLENIESAISTMLFNDWTDYQATNDLEKLASLNKLALFCKHAGINGKTSVIQQTILDEWEAKKPSE